MQDFEDDEDTLLISYSVETRLVRVSGDMVYPAKLQIRADVQPSEECSEHDLNLALTKIKFFYDSLVTKSIVFSADNENALRMFVDDAGKNRTGNLIMLTPGEPTDEVLAAVFQAKMTALANGAIEFGVVEVKSDNPVGLSFIFVGSAANILPTMADWIGERSYFEIPWWSRNDASTLDVVPQPDADLSKKPAWAFSLDVLAGPKAETGIVVRPAFKPTIIDGGKGPGEKP